MTPINETPYGFRLLPSKLEPRDPFLTIVVTGCFRLVPNGVCEALPEDEQTGPGNAEAHEDLIGNSRRLDGDLQPLKPVADCVFLGSAHAPGGQPVTALPVAFGVGSMIKELSVFGDRKWVRMQGDDVRIEGPAPFVEMPIRNEFAHGGHRSVYNKHGKGFGVLDAAPGAELALANIMPPDRVSHRWDEDAPAAGFGVLEPHLTPRIGLAGTYDETWQYTRDPLPPKDLDPRFFCGARRDQHVSGFLMGNEELYFSNLHPRHPTFVTRLPGEAVRVFVDRHAGSEGAELQFAEVASPLDTCVVDMPNEIVRLTWRGTLHVEHEDLRDIDHILIVREPLGQRQDSSQYAELLHRRLDELFPPPPPVMTAETRREIDDLNADGMKRIVQALEEGGADPALIGEVRAAKTVDEALPMLEAWLARFSKALPPAK